MPKKIRRILGNFSLLVSSILLTLVLGELLMRIFAATNNIDFTLYMQELKNSNRLPTRELYVDNNGLYELRANAQVLATTSDFSIIYKINSQGLRDKEYDFVKSKDKTRILVFGDSITFGEGIEYGERFSDIIEKSFPNLEVINFGVPGYGLDRILIKFAAEGIKFLPDYVIIFINEAMIKRFSTNIIKNNYVDLANIAVKSPSGNTLTAYISKNDVFFNKKKYFLALDKSFLFSYFQYKFCLFTLKNKLRRDDQKAWEAIYAENPNQVYSAQEKGPGIHKEAVAARTVLLIKKLNDICKNHKTKLILININDGFSDMDFLRNIDSNIIYYDLTRDLSNESRKYSLCFVYDEHYNKKANSFIGKKTNGILENIIH